MRQAGSTADLDVDLNRLFTVQNSLFILGKATRTCPVCKISIELPLQRHFFNARTSFSKILFFNLKPRKCFSFGSFFRVTFRNPEGI